MPSDQDVAKRALDLQARGRDFRLLDIPSYVRWSEARLAQGESETLIAHLDATAMFLLPEEVASVPEEDFEELLQDLKNEIET